jgi:hypothetical protein
VGVGESLDFERRREANYSNEGNNLLQRGEREAAGRAFEQALAIAERLAKADPTSSQWQRSLTVSYRKLGAVNAQRSQALQLFESARLISERLTRLDQAMVSGSATSRPPKGASLSCATVIVSVHEMPFTGSLRSPT